MSYRYDRQQNWNLRPDRPTELHYHRQGRRIRNQLERTSRTCRRSPWDIRRADGSGTIYGTNEDTTSNTRLFNVHSNYQIEGFRLNGFFDHNSLNSNFPEFLADGIVSVQESPAATTWVSGRTRVAPALASFYGIIPDRLQQRLHFLPDTGRLASNATSYTDDIVNTGATFHPTHKLSWNVTENYTSNLNGYVAQILSSNGTPVTGVDLGSGAHSSTIGGGATYKFTQLPVGNPSRRITIRITLERAIAEPI